MKKNEFYTKYLANSFTAKEIDNIKKYFKLSFFTILIGVLGGFLCITWIPMNVVVSSLDEVSKDTKDLIDVIHNSEIYPGEPDGPSDYVKLNSFFTTLTDKFNGLFGAIVNQAKPPLTNVAKDITSLAINTEKVIIDKLVAPVDAFCGVCGWDILPEHDNIGHYIDLYSENDKNTRENFNSPSSYKRKKYIKR